MRKLANEALDTVRRQEMREHAGSQEGSKEGKALKHSRWALLKNPWKLTVRQEEKLSQLKKTNQTLYRGSRPRSHLMLSGWRFSVEELTRRLLARWLDAIFRETNPESISCFEFELPMAHSTLHGAMHRDGECIPFSADIRDVAEFSLWVRSFVPETERLHFCDEGVSGQLDLRPDTSPSDIFRLFNYVPPPPQREAPAVVQAGHFKAGIDGLAIVRGVELLLRQRHEEEAQAIELDRGEDVLEQPVEVVDGDHLSTRDVTQLRAALREHHGRELGEELLGEIELHVEALEPRKHGRPGLRRASWR
jgi:hypothetical protein